MIQTNSSRLAQAAGASVGDKVRSALAIGKTRWGMLALVFFATTLNYIDRAA
ncbi:MAG: MFS transporter, partial [Pseudomonas sp.]|nr:MFS transporter [Pseudomonas sp.]